MKKKKTKKFQDKRIRVSMSLRRGFWQKLTSVSYALNVNPGRFVEIMWDYIESLESGKGENLHRN